MQDHIINSLLVFTFMFIIDVVWTDYFIYVEKRRALPAGICSVIIYGLGSYTTLKWVEEPLYVVPAVIGAFFGTYCTVRYYGSHNDT